MQRGPHGHSVGKNVNASTPHINHKNGLSHSQPPQKTSSQGQWSISSLVTSKVNSLKAPTVATAVSTTNHATLVTNVLSNSNSNVTVSTSSMGAVRPTDKQSLSMLKVKEEPKPMQQQDLGTIRDKVLEYYLDSIEELKGNYKEKLQELFFIQSGGNMVDYPSWKLRSNPHLLSFLNVYRLDDSTSYTAPTATNTLSPSIRMQARYSSAVAGNTTQLTSTYTLNSSRTSIEQYGFVDGVHSSLNKSKSDAHNRSSHNNEKLKLTNFAPQQQRSSVSHDDIADQVRHESEILHKVSLLRKSGLWSASRLPKVYEQPRKKAHWDYVLEEMQWLAADFNQEKRWKLNMAKKLSRSVMKFHQDKLAYAKRAEKEENIRMRRIASGIAKEIRMFWTQIEKLACYKQQSRQEEQRRKALDLHLNFIVGQTEKYSSWLAEGMKESTVSSPVSSRVSVQGDDDFDPSGMDEDDDEATIDEQEQHDQAEYEDELDALRRESEMPIEELLDTLPENMIKRIAGKDHQDDDSDDEDVISNESSDEDSDIDVESSSPPRKKLKPAEDSEEEDGGEYVLKERDMVEDDEQTLDQEEAHGDIDHQAELDELEKEGELPIEELLKRYGAPGSLADSNDSSDADKETDEESMGEDDISERENSPDIPLNVLETSMSENEENKRSSEKASDVNVPNQELNDAAATAESLQPKGFTLSTTQVKTKIPFLLRHTLREYQHIGLDWLVTMYNKQLNGILADEMGLGKTIQTIALLAHLACEDGCWGPHLIVVPTSVMLNWEFEFKKWCPGFKILTYFGTQKERKLKRTGWSKPNAFHVCITSYKLVIQDHQAFRRRKWKYLILDEAQNIKNFKSQRWQMLLNFNSQRRLLLTGTPLQNSLMELWSLMHFLMPNVFQSHLDFKEWFSNPLTGMIEGSREYNEGIVKRLHTVLRPFLLRRLKSEVELQMPKKYEHVIKCRLSKRQRFLYDEFMSRTKTKETLAAGNFLSVINILMQLRKVCNHPDLFELRPTIAPFIIEGLVYQTSSLVRNLSSISASSQINLSSLNLRLIDLELQLGAFQARRTNQLKVPRAAIQNKRSQDLNLIDYVIPDLGSSQFQLQLNRRDSSTMIREIEDTRSYLDAVITPSAGTNGGYAVIGDVLKQQVEDSIDSSDVDFINVDDSSDDAVFVTADSFRSSCMKKVQNSTNGGKLIDDYINDQQSPFLMEKLRTKCEEQRQRRLSYMAEANERHCAAAPLYGKDLHNALSICNSKMSCPAFITEEYLSCTDCDLLRSLVKAPKTRLYERRELTKRFSLYVCPVVAPPITIKTSHVNPSIQQQNTNFENRLAHQLVGKTEFLYPLKMNGLLQFPETRLVQYDCGKLQALDALLRQLKTGKHRVLIFTQMTKMLDVLERFLNYHGYIYLRLDGNTKVEQRQMLMERFNQDEKVFVFILSTRSGGIGVNLTGADTVVFYDSDWNPTMDAQAQDRCHRIGQTRDVHIYRLISDRTVEENILKKAHQKRLLGDLAIEGGNFTAAYFKKDTVKDLFDVESLEEDILPDSNEKKPGKRKSKNEEGSKKDTEVQKEEATAKKEFEEVLANVEEEEDAKAAVKAKAEQDSELLEFKDTTSQESSNKKELSKVEESLSLLEAELRPVERLALRFMESSNTYLVEDETEETERQLELRKKEWELDHLQSLREQEERKNAEEEDDMFFTYIRDETYDKVNNSKSKTTRNRKSLPASIMTSTVEKSIQNHTKSGDSGLSSPKQEILKPLNLKVDDKKLAKIKKTAEEAIKANAETLKDSPPKDEKIEKIKVTKTRKKVGNNKEKIAANEENKTQSTGNSPIVFAEDSLPSPKPNPVEQMPLKEPPVTIPNGIHEKQTNRSRTKRAVTLFEYMSQEPASQPPSPLIDSPSPVNEKTDKNSKKYPPDVNTKTRNKQKTLEKIVQNITKKSANNTIPTTAGSSTPSQCTFPNEKNQNGDKRRSSRTPRPKYVENDDWLLFS